MSAVRRRTRSWSREEPENFNSGYGYPVSNGETFVVEQEQAVDSLDMSCRDRTGEFLSAVKSLQSSTIQKVNIILRRGIMSILGMGEANQNPFRFPKS